MNKLKLTLGALSLGFMTTAWVSAEEYVTKEEFLELQKQMQTLSQQLSEARKEVASNRMAKEEFIALEQKVEDVGKTWEDWFTRDLQYYRQPGKKGINVFEAPKTTDVEFDGVKVRVGGASTLQFQGLSHDNDSGNLNDLTNNFNLATANLDLDVALAEGIRMHQRVYLSSRHHAEAWVKGGYLQIDSLDFIQDDFLAGMMDHLRLKVGHLEVNYGDNHFRRTDNADAMYNPFIGNYIMDSFTTEVGAEVYYFQDDFFAMVGLTNGKLNQSPAATTHDKEPSYVAKLGYDSQINEDLRVRLTGSMYAAFNTERQYLYAGDRSGSRYYEVLNGGDFGGRFNPDPGNPRAGNPSDQSVAFMLNPFVKYKGFEVYGVLETVSGEDSSGNDYDAQQYAAEVLYRFGEDERFYVGARYNLVEANLASGEDVDIDRINLGGGWFITNNVLAKVEYVTQNYNGDFGSADLNGAEFDGILLEGAISF